MNKLAELKARAAVASQRLKAVHDSREEDNRVIIDMWSQIREKFEAQDVELGVYRGKIATLEANNRELSDLLGTFLSTINGAVDGEAIETVSGITAMATELLDAPSGESVGAAAEPPEIPPMMDLDTEAPPIDEMDADGSEPGNGAVLGDRGDPGDPDSIDSFDSDFGRESNS